MRLYDRLFTLYLERIKYRNVKNKYDKKALVTLEIGERSWKENESLIIYLYRINIKRVEALLTGNFLEVMILDNEIKTVQSEYLKTKDALIESDKTLWTKVFVSVLSKYDDDTCSKVLNVSTDTIQAVRKLVFSKPETKTPPRESSANEKSL